MTAGRRYPVCITAGRHSFEQRNPARHLEQDRLPEAQSHLCVNIYRIYDYLLGDYFL